MHKINFNYDLCNGCKICVDACFVDVIRWDKEKGAPIGAYPEDCQFCRLCAVLCPENAIDVIPDWRSKHYPRVLARAEW